MSTELSAPAKHVAHVLYRHLNKDGKCFPSVAKIAKKSSLNRKTVMPAIRALEASGWLSVLRHRGGKNEYTISSQTSADIGTSTDTGTGPKYGTGVVPFLGPDQSQIRDTNQESNQVLNQREGGSQGSPLAKPSVSSKAKKRASRISVESLPADWETYCREKRPDLDPAEVFENFRDYWLAKPGAGGVKLDWFATWRTWVRKESQKAVRPTGTHGSKEF